jgi:hypothetical protein
MAHERCRGRRAAGGNGERRSIRTVRLLGIGFGGLDAKAALFWAFVGIPLAWGVWKTLESAVKIL